MSHQLLQHGEGHGHDLIKWLSFISKSEGKEWEKGEGEGRRARKWENKKRIMKRREGKRKGGLEGRKEGRREGWRG
jgi:hypothetical protein